MDSITPEDIDLITQFKAQVDQQIIDLMKLSDLYAKVLASPPVDLAVTKQALAEATLSRSSDVLQTETEQIEK